MAKLIRFLSGRWTIRNSRSTDLNARGGVGGGVGGVSRHQRSRSADHHGLLMCKVALLDGTDVILDVPRRSLGAVLYEKVFSHLDLIETDYFGLQFTDELNIHCWLDSTKSIRRQVQLEKNSHGEQMYVFRFRVKFYSSDPNNLKEEITRYQFFLQLKSDVESGRLHCPKETAVDLAALVLQAELGDFDESQHKLGLISEFKFVPNQTEEMEIAILKKFKTYRGQTPSRCELIYLNKTKCLELYGVDFNIVRGKDGNQYQLGLMPAGILVCERSQKIGLFCWPKITKLQFKKKQLHLEVVESDDRGQEQEHTFIFRLDSEKACKVLWRCAVQHHTFFRLSSPIKPYGLKSDFFRLGSRVRYSGSTELQTVSRAVHHRDIKFQRRLSKRYSRREKFDRLEKEENNRHGNDHHLYAPTKRWSVAGTQASSSSRRKSRDLSSASETNQRTTTTTTTTTGSLMNNQLEREATTTLTRATDAAAAARSSMQRRRSRNYSSGRSPSRVIDSDNNNVAKAAKLPSLVPVQVTVSTQESFDDDFEQRTMMNAVISYSSLHMPRGRSRGAGGGGGGMGGGGGVGERDLTSKLQSQSYFPPRQTPHRLSMLPRQQEFHQFKESYSEDLGHQNAAIVHYQVASGRRNNWSVDNLYNGHQIDQSSPHFVVSHKYVSYDEERPLAHRPPPIHRTNLATQV